jgi:hypothetical protein
MSLSWLGYPQLVLAVWCPLVVLGLWYLSSAASVRLRARERFVLGLVAAVTPLLSFAVPYMPDSPLRDALPWRAPLAWGISNGINQIQVPLFVDVVMALAMFLPPLSLVVSLTAGCMQVVRTRRRINALGPQRRGDVWVIDSRQIPGGFGACTVGLLRPRIIIDSATESSPNASVIIEHEKSHARARHPLWIFVATCILRAWWWIPGTQKVLRELKVTAELWADQDARDTMGAPAVARALSAHLSEGSRPVESAFASAGASAAFADPCVELTHRALALATPPRVVSHRMKVMIWATVTIAVLIVIVLL